MESQAFIADTITSDHLFWNIVACRRFVRLILSLGNAKPARLSGFESRNRFSSFFNMTISQEINEVLISHNLCDCKKMMYWLEAYLSVCDLFICGTVISCTYKKCRLQWRKERFYLPFSPWSSFSIGEEKIRICASQTWKRYFIASPQKVQFNQLVCSVIIATN